MFLRRSIDRLLNICTEADLRVVPALTRRAIVISRRRHAQPGFESIGQRPAFLLTYEAALFGLRPRISFSIGFDGPFVLTRFERSCWLFILTRAISLRPELSE